MPQNPNPVNYPLSLASQPSEDPACTENFFRKVRRIDAQHPHHPRTGFALKPSNETIRFRQIPHLHFAPASIGQATAYFDPEAQQTVEEIMVYFMGLLGVNGPLPAVLNEVVIAQAKGIQHPDLDDVHGNKPFRPDAGPAAFIDLFNHRFISLFYRAAVSSNKAVDFDRPEESRFHAFIGSFIGLGIPATQHRMDIPDTAALYFAGHYACPTHHAEGLCDMVADFTGAPVAIQQNLGHWVPVPTANQTTLGVNRQAGRLGQGTMLGAKYWDRTMKFRLVLGPLKWAEYQDYSPAGSLAKALKSMILLYCGREFVCELNPVLAKAEVPACVLGGGSRLGFSSWLKCTPPAADAADYKLTLIA